MAKLIERYCTDEIGSKTVDWIVLGAGVVMLSAALIAATLPGERTLASDEGPTLSIEDA